MFLHNYNFHHSRIEVLKNCSCVSFSSERRIERISFPENPGLNLSNIFELANQKFSFGWSVYLTLKFRYSEKATKFETFSTDNLTPLSHIKKE